MLTRGRVGDALDAGRAIEHQAGLDAAFQHVRHQLVHVGADRRGAAGEVMLA